jgi:F420-dependent methylenetetrahydromethanopterin dehydrogenase
MAYKVEMTIVVVLKSRARMAPAAAQAATVDMVRSFYPNCTCASSLTVSIKGPTYCGDGCVSQCDAVAECGQYSETGNKTCPLNVWYDRISR